MATTCELIAKSVLGSNTANIQFTSIPATYDDLLLVCSLRTTRSGFAFDNVEITFNGSTSGYSERMLYGNGASAASYANTSAAKLVPIINPAANATSNTFSNSEIYIPNYAGSTNKSVSATDASETNASTAYIAALAGLWANTAAITSILIKSTTGANDLVSGSSAYLYGITKA